MKKHVYINVCVRYCAFVFTFIYMCVCMHVSGMLCMHVCVCVCVCAFGEHASLYVMHVCASVSGKNAHTCA